MIWQKPTQLLNLIGPVSQLSGEDATALPIALPVVMAVFR